MPCPNAYISTHRTYARTHTRTYARMHVRTHEGAKARRHEGAKARRHAIKHTSKHRRIERCRDSKLPEADPMCVGHGASSCGGSCRPPPRPPPAARGSASARPVAAPSAPSWRAPGRFRPARLAVGVRGSRKSPAHMTSSHRVPSGLHWG
jgi:hypothetical protein